jgi:YD repeat-containing protein
MSRQIFTPGTNAALIAAIKSRAVPNTGVSAWDRAVGGIHLTDLYTVASGNIPGDGIPNGTLIVDVNSAFTPTSFFGPDEISTVYLGFKGDNSTRYAVVGSGLSSQGDAGTFAPTLPTAGTITYNALGQVTQDTDGNTYTYNIDASVHTQTLNGVTRTYAYDATGNLTGVN